MLVIVLDTSGEMMRKLVAGLFITVDGVTSNPEQWQFPYMDQELGQHLGTQFGGSDTLLLGRRTYEEWAAFWPHQSSEIPFATYMNQTPKVVVSTTLKELAWGNSRLINSAIPHRITQLKEGPGKAIVVNGSLTLVRSLLAHRLLDELSLLIHPVVVGNGVRLLDGSLQTALTLTDTTIFKNGVISVTYAAAQD
jgi:dihydrofolate reductase